MISFYLNLSTADAVNMELEEQGQLLMRSADNVSCVFYGEMYATP